MSLRKQLFTLILTALLTVLFLLGIYTVFTKRCVDTGSEGLKAKSIELAAYLPFDESSQVARVPSSLKLEGALPILDGAAAPSPIFAIIQAKSVQLAVLLFQHFSALFAPNLSSFSEVTL